MSRGGLWLRVFVGLLLGVVPPIVLLVIALLAAESVLQEADPLTIAVVVVGAAVLWCVLLGAAFARQLADEVEGLIATARRGAPEEERIPGSPNDALATALEERNRQVSLLAQQSGSVAINARPTEVAHALAAAVHSVLNDTTWRLAIVSSGDAVLPPGVYGPPGGDSPFTELGDLERWAAVTDGDDPTRLIEGPWGAFVAVAAPAGERVRTVLLAPWEGRTPPMPAELDLMKLVGQHVGISLEHSILYARVSEQANELERLAAVQSDFLRGVTHDLQTPLTSIGAVASELRASAGLSDGAMADLDTISQQAERLRRMVGQLLTASRLEAGALTAQQEVFAIQPVIERTWAALRAERPFRLSVDGSPHLAVGDPDRTEQVLWAVLDNSVKYSPDGSPVQVVVQPRGGWLRVSITDSGTGMDPVTQERAFEQFFRADAARSLAPDGSGVGLYAARGLMRAMGGDIELQSTLGHGSTVTISIPAEPSAMTEDASAGEKGPGDEREPSSGPGATAAAGGEVQKKGRSLQGPS